MKSELELEREAARACEWEKEANKMKHHAFRHKDRADRAEAENARLRDALEYDTALLGDLKRELYMLYPEHHLIGRIDAAIDATPPPDGSDNPDLAPGRDPRTSATSLPKGEPENIENDPAKPGYDRTATYTPEQAKGMVEPPHDVLQSALRRTAKKVSPQQAHGDALAAQDTNLKSVALSLRNTECRMAPQFRKQLAGIIDDVRANLTASGVPEKVRRLPEHFRTVSVFSHQTEESTLAWKEAANQLESALASTPAGEVVVTTNKAGECVAVTRQDGEGQILSVIWERAGD